MKSHIWRLSVFVTWCSAFDSVWLQLMCHFVICSYAFLGGACVFPSGSLIQSSACAFVSCFLLPRSASVSSSRCSDRFLCSCRDSELKSEFYFPPWKGKVRSGCRDGVCFLLLSAYEQRLKTLCVQMSLWSRGCLLLQLVWFWSAACSFSSSLSRSLSTMVHNHHLTFFSAGLWRKAVNWASLRRCRPSSFFFVFSHFSTCCTHIFFSFSTFRILNSLESTLVGAPCFLKPVFLQSCC